MATYIGGPLLDPLGAALGQGLAQGFGEWALQRGMSHDQAAMLNYVRQLQQAQNMNAAPQMGPTDVQGPSGGWETQVAPPQLRTPQMQQMLMQMELGRILSPIQQAQIAESQAQSRYYDAHSKAILNPPEKPQASLPKRVGDGNEYGLPAGSVIQFDANGDMKILWEPGKASQDMYGGAPWYMNPQHPSYGTEEASKLRADAGAVKDTALDRATTLRAEFNASQVTKNFQTIQQAERNIGQAYKLSISPETKSRVASDQALAVGLQKMLDPTSVVRESEYARTPEGVSLINQIESYVPKLQKGGLGITNEDRSAIYQVAQKLLLESKRSMNEHIERYTTLASDYKVNPRWIMGNIKPLDLSESSIPQPQSQEIEISPEIKAMTEEQLKALAGVR